MSDVLEKAARFDDIIEHTNKMLGAVVGFIAGVVVAAVAIVVVVGTAGLGTVLGVMIMGLVGVAASKVGEWVGSFFPDDAGNICEGSTNVFIGTPLKRAARVKDKVNCHSGMIIVTGCKYIFINGLNAVRVKEETECDGKVKTGSESVWFGGPSVQVAPKRFSGELWAPFWVFREVVDVVTTVYFFVRGGGFKWKGASLWDKFGTIGDIFGFFDKGLSWGGIFAEQTGNYETSKLIESITNHPVYKTIDTIFSLQGAADGLGDIADLKKSLPGSTPSIGAPSTHTPSAPSNTPSAPSNTPSAPSNTPSAPSNTPSAPSNTPSAPSNTPSAPSNTPSAPSNTPSAPSNTPAASSNTPSAPSNTPSAPSNTPSAPSNTPSAPSNTPSAPSNIPSAPSNTPSAPSNTPSAPSNTPSAPSNTPSAPSNTPSAPSNTPSAQSNTPSAPSNTPSAPSNTPSAPSNTPSAPSNTPSAPSNTPSAPSNTPKP